MLQTLQILSVMFAAFTMAQMLAHALEFPGKRRLDRDTYLKVQAIYYPVATTRATRLATASARATWDHSQRSRSSVQSPAAVIRPA